MHLDAGRAWPLRQDSGLVFTRCSPGRTARPSTRNAAPTGSGSTPARPGLPRIRLHDLRHSDATAALAAGIPAASSASGWAAHIAITMDPYSHVLPGLDAAAADTVARLILGDSGTAPESCVTRR